MVGTRVGGVTDMSGRLLRLVKALARSIAMELGLDRLVYWIEVFKDRVQCARVVVVEFRFSESVKMIGN